MSQSPIAVTQSLESVLARIEEKIDTLQKDSADIKIALSKLEEKSNAINQRLDDSKDQIKELQSRINGQTNWFIGVFSVLVAGLLGLFGKIAFFPNL
jgi:peptidoglycan hydrolase CwlO-like protein